MTDLAFFLATSGHSGVDRVMGNLIGELARRGLRIDVLRIEGHGPHLPELPPNVRLFPLGAAHVNSCFLPLVKYLRREKPRVLLSDKDRLNRLALWARKVAGVATRVAVRMGTTVSENLAKRGRLERSLQYGSIRWFYPWADAVLVPSCGAAEDIIRIGRLRPEIVRVVPSPIVHAGLQAKAREAAEHPWFNDGGPPVVLGVGELCERKDFATLLQAFARLRKEMECRLLILGEGRKRQELESLAASLGVKSAVSLPGFVANPYAFMSRAALFVLASRCEGSPVVLMEALACGAPVVATDCPSGPREILQGGRLGPLVPIGDVEALARAMQSVLLQPPLPAVLRAGAEPFQVAASADCYLHAVGFENA